MTHKIETIDSRYCTPHPVYLRKKPNEDHILNLAEAYHAATSWPFPHPVHLLPVPADSKDKNDKKARKDGFTFYILEGVHRTLAAKSIKKPVQAHIHPAGTTMADIILLQFRENGRHGLILSTEARADGIKALKDAGLSLSEIATQTGLSKASVSRISRDIQGKTKEEVSKVRKEAAKKGPRQPKTGEKKEPKANTVAGWETMLVTVADTWKTGKDNIRKTSNIVSAEIALALDALCKAMEKPLPKTK